MTLHDRPLDRLAYKGRTYRLTLAFDRVFRVMEIFADDLLFPADKARLALKLLVKGRAPVGILEPLFKELFGEAKKRDGTRSFDFLQDAGYIYAAFRQAYGIDLHAERGRLHWHEFIALFSALPEDTRIAQIMAIRARPLPKPNGHNAEEIQAVLRQKLTVELKKTEQEREAERQKQLNAMFDSLLSLAEG